MTTFTAVASPAVEWMHRAGAAWVAVQPGDYDPSSGRGPEWGKAAPAGLLIWLFLGTALFFLVKSMNRHIRRVHQDLGPDGKPVPEMGTGESVAAGGESGGEAPGDLEAEPTSSADAPSSRAVSTSSSAGPNPGASDAAPEDVTVVPDGRARRE